jgi:hypothetical protein
VLTFANLVKTMATTNGKHQSGKNEKPKFILTDVPENATKFDFKKIPLDKAFDTYSKLADSEANNKSYDFWVHRPTRESAEDPRTWALVKGSPFQRCLEFDQVTLSVKGMCLGTAQCKHGCHFLKITYKENGGNGVRKEFIRTVEDFIVGVCDGDWIKSFLAKPNAKAYVCVPVPIVYYKPDFLDYFGVKY